MRARTWPTGALPDGLALDDLIAIGWLAWVEHRARYPHSAPQRYWERARWAMTEALIGDRDLRRDAVGPIEHVARTLADERTAGTQAGSPVRRFGLRRADIRALRAAMHRALPPRQAALLVGLLIEGESLATMGQRLGCTETSVQSLRSKAVRAMVEYVGRHARPQQERETHARFRNNSSTASPLSVMAVERRAKEQARKHAERFGP
ncbi:MAG TPA: hypothetical protein VF158_02810 [Longimicrobiales bacterium]